MRARRNERTAKLQRSTCRKSRWLLRNKPLNCQAEALGGKKNSNRSLFRLSCADTFPLPPITPCFYPLLIFQPRPPQHIRPLPARLLPGRRPSAFSIHASHDSHSSSHPPWLIPSSLLAGCKPPHAMPKRPLPLHASLPDRQPAKHASRQSSKAKTAQFPP